jgi:VWFA-related protein
VRRYEVVTGTLAIACMVAGLAFPIRGQDQSGAVKVDVKVVSILATVRDKKGQIVANLGKDDFVLQEDGRPQTISYFSKDTNLPLTLGLLVDTSESQRNVLDQERAASHTFLDTMLRETDKAFVIHFDREVELLQDLTSDRDKLARALDLLEVPRPELRTRQSGSDPNGGGGYPGGDPGAGSGYPGRQRGGYPGGGGYPQGGRGLGAGTLLYDSIFLASDEVLHTKTGRKALIILSDGVDHGSKESLDTAIMTAQRADAIVYSIYFADTEQERSPVGFGGPGIGGMGRGGRFPRGGGGRPFPQQESRVDGKKILERISKETGGRLFEVTKKQSLGEIYDSIAEELRNQYSLGYTPAGDTSAGYHKLRLTTKQKDDVVQARDGYYNGR